MNTNPQVPENSYYQRKMENDFNHFLLGQIGKEPNRVSSFLNTDKFYNAVSRDHAISILDKPGVLKQLQENQKKVQFHSDLVPEIHTKRIRDENQEYVERMKFLRDLRNKLSDKEREIAIAEYETEVKTKLQGGSGLSR